MANDGLGLRRSGVKRPIASRRSFGQGPHHADAVPVRFPGRSGACFGHERILDRLSHILWRLGAGEDALHAVIDR